MENGTYEPTDCQPIVNSDYDILQSSCEKAQCNNNHTDSWKSGAESNCLFSIDELKGESEVCHDARVNAAMDLGRFP